MRKIFFILITGAMMHSATAQVTFQKTYGTTAIDAMFKFTRTYDGGYAFAGQTEALSAAADVYFFKTDGLGVPLWAVILSGNNSEFVTDFIETADHGFLIAGGTSSFGSGSDDAFLVKTDAGGFITWGKVYGGPQQDYFLSVEQTNDGGFIAVGNIQSFSAGSSDIIVVRTDASGDTLWTRIMGGVGFEEATSVIQTAEGGFALCGRSSSFTASSTEALLIKLNASGDSTWAVQFGNSGAEEAHSVKQTFDNGYILFGNATSFGNDYEPYLNRFSSSGSLLWSKLYSGPKSDAIYDGIITSDSGFAMCGFTESFGEGHRGTDSANYYVIRTNMNGDTLWTHTYGGEKADEAFGIMQTADGGLGVFGFSRSFGDTLDGYFVKTDSQGHSGCHEEPSFPQVLTPTTLVSGIPLQINRGVSVASAPFGGVNPPMHDNILCLYDGINKMEINTDDGVIFPNPFTNQATIKFNKEISEGVLYLYNMFGQVVLEKSNINGRETVIHSESIGSGMYFIEVIQQGKIIYTGKAVVY